MSTDIEPNCPRCATRPKSAAVERLNEEWHRIKCRIGRTLIDVPPMNGKHLTALDNAAKDASWLLSIGCLIGRLPEDALKWAAKKAHSPELRPLARAELSRRRRLS